MVAARIARPYAADVVFNDLRLLTVFVAVYQQRGITAAARVLNVSQPSVTRSIKTLEHELGTKLFERSANGMSPNTFAERLYKRALAIVDHVDSIYDDVTGLSKQDRILIRVGVGFGCCLEVCDTLTSFIDAHPDFVFNVSVASARSLLAEAESKGVDVIVAKKETLDTASWLHVEAWQTLPIRVLARRDHPVFDLPVEQQLEAIRGYPFMTRHMLESAHGSYAPGEVSLRANDHSFLFRAIAQGNGYMWVGQAMVEFALPLGLRPVGDKPLGFTEYALAYPRESGPGTADMLVGHLRTYRES